MGYISFSFMLSFDIIVCKDKEKDYFYSHKTQVDFFLGYLIYRYIHTLGWTCTKVISMLCYISVWSYDERCGVLNLLVNRNLFTSDWKIIIFYCPGNTRLQKIGLHNTIAVRKYTKLAVTLLWRKTLSTCIYHWW